MIIDKALANTEFLQKSLQASVYKSEVINSNIANADTPGYKRRVVNFDSSLQSAVDEYRKTGVVDLDDVNPTTTTEDITYRIDGNGVVMEQEMVELYQNAARYDMMVNSVNFNFNGIKTVLTR